MQSIVTFIAATEAAQDDGIMGAFGIDVPTLIFQGIAFLLLVVVLGKWVFPVFMAAVDRREERISESLKAADEARQAADTAGEDVARLLKEARNEASEIVSTAKQEAAVMVQDAETKARNKAEAIAAASLEELDKEVLAAKKMLRDEALDLVALATEKVVSKTVSDGVDASLIKASLKEAGER